MSLARAPRRTQRRDERERAHARGSRARGLSAAALRRLLEHRGDVTWLDPRREWLVVPARSSRARTGLRKMLSIARSLSLDDVDEGLRRSARPVALPRAILRSMCETFDWIAVDRRSDAVTATVPLDPARTLSPLERELVRIFRTDGPVLAFARAVQLAADAGHQPDERRPLSHADARPADGRARSLRRARCDGVTSLRENAAQTRAPPARSAARSRRARSARSPRRRRRSRCRG